MNMQIGTRCCVVGGGSGMVLGFLLAGAGVDVWVLEKHADFLRDLCGDTIHPSTLHVMDELGLLDELLKRPHQEVRQLAGHISKDGRDLRMSGLRSHAAKRLFSPSAGLSPHYRFLST